MQVLYLMSGNEQQTKKKRLVKGGEEIDMMMREKEEKFRETYEWDNKSGESDKWKDMEYKMLMPFKKWKQGYREKKLG